MSSGLMRAVILACVSGILFGKLPTLEPFPTFAPSATYYKVGEDIHISTDTDPSHLNFYIHNVRPDELKSMTIAFGETAESSSTTSDDISAATTGQSYADLSLKSSGNSVELSEKKDITLQSPLTNQASKFGDNKVMSPSALDASLPSKSPTSLPSFEMESDIIKQAPPVITSQPAEIDSSSKIESLNEAHQEILQKLQGIEHKFDFVLHKVVELMLKLDMMNDVWDGDDSSRFEESRFANLVTRIRSKKKATQSYNTQN